MIRRCGQEDPGHHRVLQIVTRYGTLTGLLLNADQVIVGKSVGAGMVLGFDGRLTITDHQVQKRDSTAQSREGGQKSNRQRALKALCVPIHRCLIKAPQGESETPSPLSNKRCRSQCQRTGSWLKEKCLIQEHSCHFLRVSPWMATRQLASA